MAVSVNRVQYDAEEYRRAMYAGGHKEDYLRVRSETLSELVSEVRRDGRPLRILEVACGPGLSLVHLGRMSRGDTLVGIDLSPGMLQGAAKNIRAAGGAPHLALASATGLPFDDGAFDIVYATRFIHIFTDKTAVLKELSRVVRDDGLLAIEFYGRPYHLIPFVLGRTRRPWRQFLWQHPTGSEVRRAMGGAVSFRPLRFGGERLLRSVLSDRTVRALLRRAWSSPLRLAVAEYFAVTRPRKTHRLDVQAAERAIQSGAQVGI